MNVFKGCYVLKNSLRISESIEPLFKKSLLQLHYPTIEELAEKEVSTIEESFQHYTRLLINKQLRENRNFKLSSEFVSSRLIDYNDYYNSYKNYLIKLYAHAKIINQETPLIQIIKNQLQDLRDSTPQESLESGLDMSSMIAKSIQDLSDMLLATRLETLIFIEELTNDQYIGTGFWFHENTKEDLTSISIYTHEGLNNNPLKMTNKLNIDLNNSFCVEHTNLNEWSGQIFNESSDYTKKVECKYNNESINDETIKLKPVFCAKIKDKKVKIRPKNINLGPMMNEGLLGVTDNSKTLEKALYNNRKTTELTITKLIKEDQQYIVFQKDTPNQTIMICYQLSKGEETFHHACLINQEILTKALSNDYSIDEFKKLINLS